MSPQPIAFVILAAGLGSRLSGAFSGRPKWMIDLDATQTIAAHHLDALDEATSGAPRLVITGAHADQVEALRKQRAVEGKPDFETVYNERYDGWNNWYSLLLGLQRLDELGWEGPTFVVNGDLFCPREWIVQMADDLPNWAPLTMAVDSHRPLTEEAMKVELVDGRVSKVGKVGLDAPAGEYIGLAGVTAEGRATLIEALTRLGEKNVTDWYEGGIQIGIDDGLEARAWLTPAADWVEVDNEEDLETARAIAAS